MSPKLTGGRPVSVVRALDRLGRQTWSFALRGMQNSPESKSNALGSTFLSYFSVRFVRMKYTSVLLNVFVNFL